MSSSRLAVATAVLAAAFALLLPPAPAGAATAIDLGTARSFAVLAGSGITNTGTTRITGDVGSFGASTSITGFETVTLVGVNHGGDAVTQKAKDDLTTAYNQAFASAPATSVATELGGRTLTPGVYHGTTLGITGALTLDTQGDPDAVFVFQADSTLITAAASSVVVLGGATACNVYWQVGSSATFGEDTALVGNVLAAESISVSRGAAFNGRLLARVGAVTMIQNTITATTCAPSAPTATATVAAPAADAAATVPVTTATIPAAAVPSAPSQPRITNQTTATTARPAGGTATTTGRPGLATTGSTTDPLPWLGAGTVVLGFLLVRLSRPLPALRHAVPRRGRTPL